MNDSLFLSLEIRSGDFISVCFFAFCINRCTFNYLSHFVVTPDALCCKLAVELSVKRLSQDVTPCKNRRRTLQLETSPDLLNIRRFTASFQFWMLAGLGGTNCPKWTQMPEMTNNGLKLSFIEGHNAKPVFNSFKSLESCNDSSRNVVNRCVNGRWFSIFNDKWVVSYAIV